MSEAEYHQVLIVGGGPAGMSTLAWCTELGLDAVLFEEHPELGGQLLRIYGSITNYLGIEAANGRELCDRFGKHLAKAADRILTGVTIAEADLSEKILTAVSGKTFRGRAIVIATGVKRRMLRIPGEREYHGRGFLESGVKQQNEVAGKRVVIIGGGDAALENALLLSRCASKVILVHRRDKFSARPEFVAAVRANNAIDLIPNAQAVSFRGASGLEAVEVKDVATGKRTLIRADHVLVRVGVEPNTEIFRDQTGSDEQGYLISEADCGTGLSGVFAAGDAVNPDAPTIAAAVGQGAIAAKAVRMLLVDR